MSTTNAPLCPNCQKRLKAVHFDPQSMLNRDQFESIKAGDWFCSTCTGDRGKRTGYRYYWDREVIFLSD